MEKILVVAPHPDDETLGCGGTILKHVERGDSVYWLIVTSMFKKEGYSGRKVAERRREIGLVGKAYGFSDVFELGFPTTRLDALPVGRIVKSFGEVINKINPDRIYLPHRNDVHSDHRVTFDAVISAAKGFRAPYVKRLMMYEVLSETEFSPPLKEMSFMPNSYSDISGYLGRKIDIMKLYKSELGRRPFPRSASNIRALAAFRGATAGVKYAEAFMTLKEVW